MSNRRFDCGDRIRYETVGDDGRPLVRYGFVDDAADEGPGKVLLDGELGVNVVELDNIRMVDIWSVTLRLDGAALLEDPSLRQGLVKLWHAEAEDAGLQITAIHPIETGVGVRDSSEGYALAEMTSAGEQYMLRATKCTDADAVMLAAGRPNRFIF